VAIRKPGQPSGLPPQTDPRSRGPGPKPGDGISQQRRPRSRSRRSTPRPVRHRADGGRPHRGTSASRTRRASGPFKARRQGGDHLHPGLMIEASRTDDREENVLNRSTVVMAMVAALAAVTASALSSGHHPPVLASVSGAGESLAPPGAGEVDMKRHLRLCLLPSSSRSSRRPWPPRPWMRLRPAVPARGHPARRRPARRAGEGEVVDEAPPDGRQGRGCRLRVVRASAHRRQGPGPRPGREGLPPGPPDPPDGTFSSPAKVEDLAGLTHPPTTLPRSSAAGRGAAT